MSDNSAIGHKTDTRLLLFLAGDSPRSVRARANLRHALEQISVGWPHEIDLLQEPDKALEYGVFATPALLYIGGDAEPAVIYGDMSDTQRLQTFINSLSVHG